MSEDWRELLEKRFGSISEAENRVAWDSAKQRLQLGEWIDGEVVSVAPFGAWLDFGVSIPGLLLIPYFRPELKPVEDADYPEIGDTIRCRLVSFNEEQKSLVLTQDSESTVF